MPDAKVITLRPRKYRCFFETGSASAVAHLAVIAASFGVQVDVREAEPPDHEEPPTPSPSSDPGSFSGDGVRLDPSM